MCGPREVESSLGRDHHFFQPHMGFLTLSFNRLP